MEPKKILDDSAGKLVDMAKPLDLLVKNNINKLVAEGLSALKGVSVLKDVPTVQKIRNISAATVKAMTVKFNNASISNANIEELRVDRITIGNYIQVLMANALNAKKINAGDVKANAVTCTELTSKNLSTNTIESKLAKIKKGIISILKVDRLRIGDMDISSEGFTSILSKIIVTPAATIGELTTSVIDPVKTLWVKGGLHAHELETEKITCPKIIAKEVDTNNVCSHNGKFKSLESDSINSKIVNAKIINADTISGMSSKAVEKLVNTILHGTGIIKFDSGSIEYVPYSYFMNHSMKDKLDADDHKQYLHIDGRKDGQTIIGGKELILKANKTSYPVTLSNRKLAGDIDLEVKSINVSENIEGLTIKKYKGCLDMLDAVGKKDGSVGIVNDVIHIVCDGNLKSSGGSQYVDIVTDKKVNRIDTPFNGRLSTVVVKDVFNGYTIVDDYTVQCSMSGVTVNITGDSKYQIIVKGV